MGDDCAVIRAPRGTLLLKVDPVLHGRHFDDSIPPEAVGAKLLKRNLSDFAAMGGGKPVAALLSLALDPRVSIRWLERFHRGLATTARRFRVPVVGGAVAEARGTLLASLSLIGSATGSRILKRTGAAIGDRICVTGLLGGSLRSGHHYRFEPRLAEGRWLSGTSGVRAMIDVSDGLAKDLPVLTPAGAEPAIFAAEIPRRRGVDLRAALCEGEDYELLFTLSLRENWTRFEKAWARRFPGGRLSCIGKFVRKGKRPGESINLADYRGYIHFAGKNHKTRRSKYQKNSKSRKAKSQRAKYRK